MLIAAVGRTHRGVTLIELAIAIVIVAVATAVGMPTINDWIQNARIRTAAESIKSGLAQARTEAVRRNMPVEFILKSPAVKGGTGWQVRLVRTDEIAYEAPNKEGTSMVLVSPTPADATTVTFTGLGRRNSSNADESSVLTKVDLDVPVSVLPSEDSRNLSITIEAGGEIRMCDPNISSSSEDPRKC